MFCLNPDKSNALESIVSTAEYIIGNYLKDHNGCSRDDLMSHVLQKIGSRTNKKDELVYDPQPIHTLAFIIAIKEMEKEGILRIDRFDVPFPMTDKHTLFYLP